MLAGCQKREMQRCVDENNRVVDDSFCAGQPQAQDPNSTVSHPYYHFYYGGWGGYGIGTQAGGGSPVPKAGTTYVSSSGRTTTIRGGFGSSMSGGEGGDGAGHSGGAGE